MKSIRKLAAIILGILLIFTACDNSASVSGEGEENYVYVAEYQEIDTPDNVKNFDNVIRVNDKFYMIVYLITGQKTVYFGSDGKPVADPEMIEAGEYNNVYTYDTTEQRLCMMDIDGENFAMFPGYKPTLLPEGTMGEVRIVGMDVCKNGDILVLEAMYTYLDDGRSIGEAVTNLIRYDEGGNELRKIDITNLSGEGEPFYVSCFALDGDDTAYLTDTANNLYVLKEDGTLDFALRNPKRDSISELVRLKDGRIGCVYYGDSITVVDKTIKDLGENIDCPVGVYNFISGSGEYDFYYMDSVYFYGYNINTQESFQLIDWMANDINADTLQCVFSLDDGRVLAISQSMENGMNRLEMINFMKADPEAIPEKIVLNLAGFYINEDLRSQIIEFNKRSTTTRINVTDYSIYNTIEDPYLGQTKLNVEMISGQIPDIIVTSDLPNFRKYASSGIFEDLGPYIDNDPELGPDSMLEGARKVLTVDGKIYQIASKFSIHTVGAPTSVVGNNMGWTIGDLKAALAKMPEGCRTFDIMTRNDILLWMLTINEHAYIDWAAGKCDFNNEEFMRLLEFIKTFPKEIDSSVFDDERSEMRKIMDGDVMLACLQLNDFREYKINDIVFDGGVSFVGFPTADGIGSIARFNDGLAISSTCSSKDDAWSFVRFLLTEDYQMRSEENYEEYYGYPTNQKIFDIILGYAAKEKDHSEYWNIDPETRIKLEALTEKQIVKLCDLINNLDGAYNYDDDILNIIMESAAPFFEGQKTVSEVAYIIQNRVSIYIDTQK